MTEQEITTAVYQALQEGRVKSVHPRVIRAIIDIKVHGMKWRDAEEKHEVTQGGILRCMRKIFV